MKQNIDVDFILQTVIELTLKAGKLALSLKKEREKADIQIENLIKKELEIFNYSFQGEETPPFFDKNTTRCFVVDPIDGSLNYQNGDENWCVSIGLLEDNKPILGVVFMPEKKLLFYVQKGKGVKCLNCFTNSIQKLQHSNKTSNLIELLGFSDRYNEIKIFLSDLLEKKYVRSRHIGSIAIACMLQALDARAIIVAGSTHLYDICAAKLIIEESGGCVFFDDKIGLFIASQNKEQCDKIRRFILC